MRANQSNDAEELASLEQRAREHAVTLERALHWSSTSKTFAAALRAGIAALSAQPRETAPRWVEVMCRQCGRPTMHMGSLCFSCSKASRGGAEAAPQPREVRGVDAVRALVAEWRQRPGITDAYKICATELETALATTPQDAAGVTGVGLLNETERSALSALLANLYHEAEDVEDSAPSVEDNEGAYWAYQQWHAITKLLGMEKIHTTPPPGVDVGKLRELVAKWREDTKYQVIRVMAKQQLANADELTTIIDAAAPWVGND